MYCSLRIYADKIAGSISAQNILSLFDLFGSIFGWSYDYISYMLFDPDADYMLIDKSYTYDSRGKKDFSDTNINAVLLENMGNHPRQSLLLHAQRMPCNYIQNIVYKFNTRYPQNLTLSELIIRKKERRS